MQLLLPTFGNACNYLKYQDEREIRSFFEVARQHPGTEIILAHSLGRNFKLLLEAPNNVFKEISGVTQVTNSRGKEFASVWREFGLERVLFGSGWPLMHPAEHVHMLKSFGLIDAEVLKIKSGAATRLFPRKLELE